MNSLLNISIEELQKDQIIDWSYTEKLDAISFNHYLNWIEKKLHGDLNYLSDHRKALRKSLNEFFPEAKSALVFLFSYQNAAKSNIENKDQKIASYVKGFEGIDYHYWIKDKLINIAYKLNLNNYKLSIDMQPVLERDLAYRSGLGWFGKNSMLINKEHGSFFIIASIIIDKKFNLRSKDLETDHCGTCTRCIDACPTNAIIDNKILDSKKCISHFTIELFKDTPRPEEFSESREEIFGCDVCQTVCPWNNKPLKKVDSKIKNGILEFFNQDIKFIKSELESMSNREFKRKFKGTPLERTGRVGLLKNIKITN